MRSHCGDALLDSSGLPALLLAGLLPAAGGLLLAGLLLLLLPPLGV
jgi:hypothetical protein